MQVTFEEIFSIIVAAGVSVDTSKITPDIPFKEAGIDSLEMMNVFLGIEEKFEIQIPDDDIAQLDTISNIVTYLNKV